MSGVEIGRKIQRLRHKKDISVRGLAAMSYMSTTKLRAIEAGRADVRLDDLCLIAKALNVTLIELLKEDEDDAL